MRVSVVIPVYNKAPFLQECLNSVFAQRFPEVEVIAVDDRSTDTSLDLLRSIQDPRLRIIALEKNLGPAGCAQRGFDAATGEYIVRMDADDVMFPERIAKQVAFMDTHPELGASGSHVELLHQPGVVRKATLSDADCRAGVLFRIPMFQPTTIYRRSVLIEHSIRFEDPWPRYGEDWLLQLRLLRVTRIANMNEALVRYRVAPQNLASQRGDMRDQRTLFSAILEWYGLLYDEAHLRQHLHAVKYYREALTPKDVADLKTYLAELRRIVDARALFDSTDFDRQLDLVWNDLAFQLPRFGRASIMAYLRLDHRRSWPKLRYLLSSFIKGRVYLPEVGEA